MFTRSRLMETVGGLRSEIQKKNKLIDHLSVAMAQSKQITLAHGLVITDRSSQQSQTQSPDPQLHTTTEEQWVPPNMGWSCLWRTINPSGIKPTVSVSFQPLCCSGWGIGSSNIWTGTGSPLSNGYSWSKMWAHHHHFKVSSLALCHFRIYFKVLLFVFKVSHGLAPPC